MDSFVWHSLSFYRVRADVPLPDMVWIQLATVMKQISQMSYKPPVAKCVTEICKNKNPKWNIIFMLWLIITTAYTQYLCLINKGKVEFGRNFRVTFSLKLFLVIYREFRQGELLQFGQHKWNDSLISYVYHSIIKIIIFYCGDTSFPKEADFSLYQTMSDQLCNFTCKIINRTTKIWHHN